MEWRSGRLSWLSMNKHFSIRRHGKKVACAIVEYVEDKDDPKESGYFLYGVYVVPKMRERGMATRLLKKVTKWADRRKVELWLTAEPQEEFIALKDLQRLYKAAGWKVAWKVHDQAIQMKRVPKRQGG